MTKNNKATTTIYGEISANLTLTGRELNYIIPNQQHWEIYPHVEYLVFTEDIILPTDGQQTNRKG